MGESSFNSSKGASSSESPLCEDASKDLTAKKESLPIEKKYSITQEVSKELRAKYGKIFIPSDKRQLLKNKNTEDVSSVNILPSGKIISKMTKYISPKEVKAVKDMLVENIRDIIQCKQKNPLNSTQQERQQEDDVDDSGKDNQKDIDCTDFIVESIDPFTYHIRYANDNQSEESHEPPDIDMNVEFDKPKLLNKEKTDDPIHPTTIEGSQNKRKRKAKWNPQDVKMPYSRMVPPSQREHERAERSNCNFSSIQPGTNNYEMLRVPYPSHIRNFSQNFQCDPRIYPKTHRPLAHPSEFWHRAPNMHNHHNPYTYPNAYVYNPQSLYLGRNHFDDQICSHSGRNMCFPTRWAQTYAYETMDFNPPPYFPRGDIRHPHPYVSDPPPLITRQVCYPPHPPLPKWRYFEI